MLPRFFTPDHLELLELLNEHEPRSPYKFSEIGNVTAKAGELADGLAV